ncbi:hypothetical protein ESA94_14055 [Lacibacter luteus]|uniref:CBM-cenC domain-containing protein n=1 Tax=Lacibacter luteus TaxID=2508719 RepID=A0A4Q1CGI0_9BACT|nr:hypothetical protein [Lacibacter luteus]RXK59260.1 hypothetical protein ESA94_14055 [Lacibacter luteus]
MKTFCSSIIASLFFLTACSKKESAENSYFFDYEQVVGWSSIQLEKGFARSGKYCERITPDKVYSNTFILPLAETGKQNLKKIIASVWVTGPEVQQDLKLVIDMYSPTENKSVKNVYMPIPVADMQGKGKWIEYKTELDIADILDGSVIAKVYVWNPGAQKFFVDDFRISFE